MLSLSAPPPPDASRRHERNHSILRPVGLAAAAVGLPDLMVHLMPSASWSGEVLSSSSSMKLRLDFLSRELSVESGAMAAGAGREPVNKGPCGFAGRLEEGRHLHQEQAGARSEHACMQQARRRW